MNNYLDKQAPEPFVMDDVSPERAAHEVVGAIDEMVEKTDLSPIELNTMHKARLIAMLRSGVEQ